MKPVTLKTVAQQAGVSIATVSKVVNGISKGISEDTIARVRQVIADTHYRPSRMGRELRAQRNFIVGMAIIDDSPAFLADPYTTQLVAGLSNHLGRNNYGLLLHGIAPDCFDDSFLLKESVVVALCIMMSGSASLRKKYLARLHASGHPMIVFQQNPIGSLDDCCFISQDDEGGARGLAAKIVKRHPRNIFILVPSLAWHAIEARVKGLQSVFKRHGCQCRIISSDEHSRQSIEITLNRAIEASGVPDVIVGTNDQLAQVAYRYCSDKGLRIPHDIGITGFNAFDADHAFGPALESVHSPAYALGETGARVLLERLAHGVFESKSVILPVSSVPGVTLLSSPESS